jgi:hypothetical protein
MPGGGTSSATQDTSQNSVNNAQTDQTSLTQALQRMASNTLQNQMQETNQSNNQATNQATNQSSNQFTDQNTNQATNQLQTNGNVQTSSTNPWAAALPTVQGLLGQLNPLISRSGITPGQTSALDTLQSNASQGNPFAGQINSATSNMLSGGGAGGQNGNISDNLASLRSQLSPYASGSMIGNNPALQAQLDNIRNDVGNSVNSQFAAAGRDLSGLKKALILPHYKPPAITLKHLAHLSSRPLGLRQSNHSAAVMSLTKMGRSHEPMSQKIKSLPGLPRTIKEI